MGDQHFYVTSVLIEDPADIQRFIEAARDRFRAVWPLPPGSDAPLALAIYDKDFDGITCAIEMTEAAEVLGGILENDVHIVTAWDPYGQPERRRVWRIPGRDGGLKLPEIPDQDDAQAI